MTIGVFLVIQFGAYTIKDLAAEAVAGVASLVAVVGGLWLRVASWRAETRRGREALMRSAQLSRRPVVCRAHSTRSHWISSVSTSHLPVNRTGATGESHGWNRPRMWIA
jgi:hypothetical protein